MYGQKFIFSGSEKKNNQTNKQQQQQQQQPLKFIFPLLSLYMYTCGNTALTS